MLTPRWIARAARGKLIRPRPVAIEGFSVDTRTLRPDQVFIALKGPRHDGHTFVREAFDKGASCAVISDPAAAPPERSNLVLVKDTHASLLSLARAYRVLFQIPLIGVTGSVGKTTTKALLGELLRTRLKAYHSPGNLNNEIGLPLSLLNMPLGTEVGVFELGVQRPGDMAPLAHLLDPSIGVITTVAEAHEGFFPDPAQLVEEKWALIDALPIAGGIAALNADDPALWNRATGQRYRVDFAVARKDVLYRAQGVECHGLEGVSFTLVHPWGRTRLRTQLLGQHNVYNVLAAVSVALELRVDLEAVQEVVAHFAPAPHRLQRRHGPFGIVLDDCYNASPSAVKAALSYVAELDSPPHKVFVFGDMLELGERSQDYHRRVAQWVQAAGVDRVFTVGRWAAETARALQQQHGWPAQRARITHSLDELEACLKSALTDQDNLILVKGSRALALDQLVNELAPAA